ncbi:bola-like protein [Vararia minispora EC-137]|uniref:Bola-like protein n=1 Tax=Vararia minispora EC-137 TaxID=1314806 RepID=A0ACB8QE16_9AGAM|nr:bola-like protein [Vararia minispora EC-137]
MLSLVRSLRVTPTLSRLRLYSVATLPQGLDTGEKAIFEKLAARFQPSELRVQDISGGCGSFYAISITSDAFRDLPTIKQHRMVNETLKQEIEGIHGLQLKTTVPQ